MGGVERRARAPVHSQTALLQPPQGEGSSPAALCRAPAGPWPPSLPPPSAASAVFADAVGLQPDARGVATSLGLNERLFVVNPQEVHELVGTRQGARA